MPRRFLQGFLLVAMLPVLSSCGSDSSPTDAPAQGSGVMSATVNGASWTVSAPFASAQWNAAGGVFAIFAADPNATYGMAISLSEFTGAGTYEIRPGFPLRTAVVTLAAASGWGTEYGDVPGTITIATLTDSRVTGTFSFTAEPAPGSGQVGSLVVTGGQFDLPVIPVG